MIKVKFGSNCLSVEYILLFLILMPCFQPSSISVGYFGVFLARLYDAAEIILYIYAIIVMIKRKLKMSIAMKLLLFSQLWIFFATIISDTEILDSLHNMMLIICTLYVIYIYSENLSLTVKVLMIHLEICIYLNVITLFIFPDRMYGFESISYGLSSEWFLGSNTGFLFWLFPAIWVAILYGNITKEWGRALVLIVFCIVNLIIKGSATAIMGVAIILILYFLPFIRKVMNPKLLILLSLVVLILVVLFTQNMQMFNWLIVGLLGRDLTFSNRVIIWENAINLITKRLGFGYGVMEPTKLAGLLGMYSATHCHNFYLQLLLNGGSVSLISFVGAQLYLIKSMRPFFKYKIVSLLVFAIVSFNIISSTENLNYPQTLILFSIASKISWNFEHFGETYLENIGVVNNKAGY